MDSIVRRGSGAGSHHTRYFDIAVPVDPKNPAAVAQAAAQAITQLAQQIASLSGGGTTILATRPGAGPFAWLAPLVYA